MLRSLTTAVSGLHYQQNRLDVIGNNIANVNTTGFRAATTHASDAFSQMLTDRSQIGSGVNLGSVSNTFTQGVISGTGQPYDMAIEGNGFFIVKNFVTGESFATRAGDFRLDEGGFLVTQDGLRVQGNDAAGNPGDIKITLSPAGLANGTQGASWQIGSDGRIMLTVVNSPGSANTTTPAAVQLGQIQVRNFRDPGALTKVGENRFSNLDAAGTDPIGTPGTAGRGILKWQALEQANVDLANQFTDLIITQRGYQANAKIITTSDEILQELINLKR